MTGKTPEDTVIYAIGDIHGRLDLLTALHERILADAETRGERYRTLVYLGDYVSRGPDSRAVVERVMAWQPAGFERVTLKGNHEDLLLRFLGGELDAGRHWFDYGGLDTLAHYGVAIPDGRAHDDRSIELLRASFAAALPDTHLAFFRSLAMRYQRGSYYFVHGGVRPGVPLEKQKDHDCMWIRKAFLDSEADHGAVVIHGHSIASEPVVRANRIGIDTGAYRSGVLTCVALDGENIRFLQT